MNRTDGKLSIPAQQHSERLTTSNSERARAGSRAVQMHVIVARDRAWTCFGPGTDHNADGLVSLGGTDRECYYVPQLLDQPSDLSTSRRRKGFIARAQTLRPQRSRGHSAEARTRPIPSELTRGLTIHRGATSLHPLPPGTRVNSTTSIRRALQVDQGRHFGLLHQPT